MADKTGGWAGWFMKRLRRRTERRPQLELLERITIGPRQTVALVEAEGRRVLVACSAEGAPVFYPIDTRFEAGVDGSVREHASQSTPHGRRVSW